MAYPTRSARLVMSGHLWGDAEIWSTSLGVHSWGSTDALPPLSPIATACSKWFTDPRSSISAAATLELIKLNEIDGEGRYLDQNNTREHEFGASPPKGASLKNQWPQLSLAISLTTGAQRGRAHRGRFYPPLTAIDPPERGMISKATCAQIAAAAAELITDLNTVFSGGWAISVLSEYGNVRHVTGVEVGNRMDTQRRRRDAWREEYEKVVLPGAVLDPGQAIPIGT